MCVSKMVFCIICLTFLLPSVLSYDSISVIYFVPISFQVLNEVRRLEESAMRNDEDLRQMTLEQQQQQRHLVIFF